MTHTSEVTGRFVSQHVLDRAASIHLAAERAEQTMNTVVGAFSLLIEQMADLRKPPDTDEVDTWCNVTMWLSEQLRLEAQNISLTLKDGQS